MAVNLYSELASAEVPDSWHSPLPRPQAPSLSVTGSIPPPPATGHAMTHLPTAAPQLRPPAITPPPAPVAMPTLSLTLPPPAATPAPRPTPMSAPTSFAVPAPVAAKPVAKRHWFGSLLVVLTIAVIGVGGAVFGPELLDRLTKVADAPAEEGDDAVAPLPSTPSGSATLPLVTATPVPVRTVTATLTGGAYGTDPATTVEVTTDFDTGLARVVMTKADGAPLEILTYGDSAFLRTTSSELWYHTSGGTLLQDLRLDRATWLLTLDQVLPEAARRVTTVNGSGVEDLGGIAVTHVAVSVDVAALRVGEPALAAAWTEQFGVGPATTAMEIHLWVDDAGMVRQSHGLYGPTIQTTITSATAEAWAPTYPDVTQWRELDARSLLELDH